MNKVSFNIDEKLNTNLESIVGNIYLHESSEQLFILAEVEQRKFCLIGLADGNRWRTPSSAYGYVFGSSNDDAIFVHFTGPVVLDYTDK